MRYLFSLLLISLLAGCGSSDTSEQPAVLTQYEHTARMNILKDIDIGVEANNYIRLRPMLLNNTLLLADNNGYMVSIDTIQGKLNWESQLSIKEPSDIGGNEALYLIGSLGGQVIAIDATSHEEIWKAQVSSEVLTRPVLEDGVVVVKTVDGVIAGLDVRNGQQLWIYKRDVPSLSVRGHSTPVVFQGAIITGLDNGRVVALELKTGRMMWEKVITIPHGRSETERLVDVDADIIIKNGIAFISGYQGRIVALDLSTAEFIWLKRMSVVKNMVLLENQLYVTDENSHIWAIDITNGATIWKQTAFTARNLTSPAVMDDKLLFGDRLGYIHIISRADGHKITHFQVEEDAPVDIKPIAAGEQVGVVTQTARYYQLGLHKVVQ